MPGRYRLLRSALQTKRSLTQFLRHPLTEIKNVPDWSWKHLLAVEALITASTAALAGIVGQKISFSIIFGIIFSPILILISLSVGTLFFYYCFQIFAQRTVSLRRLFTVMLFAIIPAMVLRIIEPYVPPITLVGMAFTALLLQTGFVENFQLKRKLVVSLIVIGYLGFFGLWLAGQMTSTRHIEQNFNHSKMEAPEVHLGQ